MVQCRVDTKKLDAKQQKTLPSWLFIRLRFLEISSLNLSLWMERRKRLEFNKNIGIPTESE